MHTAPVGHITLMVWIPGDTEEGQRSPSIYLSASVQTKNGVGYCRGVPICLMYTLSPPSFLPAFLPAFSLCASVHTVCLVERQVGDGLAAGVAERRNQLGGVLAVVFGTADEEALELVWRHEARIASRIVQVAHGQAGAGGGRLLRRALL